MVNSSEDFEYIGAPCGKEDNKEKVKCTTFGDTGVYLTLKEIEPIIAKYVESNSNKLFNISINKGQHDMFSVNSSRYATNGVTEDEFIRAHRELVKKEKAKMAGYYRPLPDCLTIKKSCIDGLGVFAKKRIFLLDVRDPYEWMTHIALIFNKEYDQPINQLFRTPVGGFINHSINPNCNIGKISQVSTDDFTTEKYFLRPLRDIEADEEITVDYTKELCGLSGYDGAEFLKDK